MKTRLTLVLAILLTLCVASCYPVSTRSDDPGSLKDFLGLLLISGGIASATAFFFEKCPGVDEKFAALSSRQKRLAILTASFAFPFAAWALGYGLGYFDASADTLYQVARAGFEAFTASQVAHMVVLK